MIYKKTLKQIREKVISDFARAPNLRLLFHNLEHTKKVVSRADKIGKYYKLEPEPMFMLLVAAWFQDIGYLYGKSQGNEKRSAEIAGAFLASEGFGSELIGAVKNIIATAASHNTPDDLITQILYDANFYYVGTKAFLSQNKLLKKEQEWELTEKIPKEKWITETIEFLEAHQFQTSYGREKLGDRKQRNLIKLQEKLQTRETGEAENKLALEPEKKAETKAKRPERGIETMLRITSSNHQRLSDMADNKAHIMITANSIIISVLLSILLRKLEDNPNLTAPTIILLGVCVSSMVFAILSTRPSLPQGTFSEAQLDSRQVNLLFFGNFYKMDLEAYDHGMRAMMDDPEFLYGSMIHDIHAQGNVLGTKYKHLRLAYSIFMFGIITSVVAFLFASMII